MTGHRNAGIYLVAIYRQLNVCVPVKHATLQWQLNGLLTLQMQNLGSLVRFPSRIPELKASCPGSGTSHIACDLAGLMSPPFLYGNCL
jgi:hypothetical protein